MYPKREAEKAKLGQRRNVGVYRVSGEDVTQAQIAERLGITVDAAEKRMRTLRQLPGCITWERLQR